jgi:hypothetical protein
VLLDPIERPDMLPHFVLCTAVCVVCACVCVPRSVQFSGRVGLGFGQGALVFLSCDEDSFCLIN